MAHPQQFLQHWFPPPQQQFATADFQELAKAAALRNNANHLALPVRLANSSSQNDHTNSNTVVRSLIRRFDLEGKHITVAENVRKWMEEDNPEWMVQIGRRVGAGYINKDGKAAFLFLYGDGYETLLLLDGIDPPEDLSKVPTIGISASFAPAVGEIDQDTAAKQGLLEPSDSLWEHVNFELNRQQGNDRSLVLHTSSRVSVRSYEDMHRKRVIRVWTLGPHRSTLGRIERDTKLETQWKLGWRGSANKAKLPAAPEPARALALPAKKGAAIKAAPAPPKGALASAKTTAPAPAVPPPTVTNGGTAAATAVAIAPPAAKPSTSQDMEIDAGHIVLSFKPRELLLLERAFDDSLTDADLATNCELWGDADFKAAFKICKTNGLRWTGIEKKRKSEGGDSVPAKKPRVRKTTVAKSTVPKVVKPPAPPAVEKSDTADDSSKESGDTPLLEALSKEAGKPKQTEKVAKPTPSKEAGKPKETEKATKSTPSKVAEKQKETEKATKPTPSKEADKTKETEKATKQKEAAKPATPKPKKSEPNVKADVSSDIEVQPKEESPTKDPDTPTGKSSPDKNVSSALKKEKEDNDDDDKDEKPKKKGGRPKGSKNKPKDEKEEKKDASKTRTKSKPKASGKATDGKK